MIDEEVAWLFGEAHERVAKTLGDPHEKFAALARVLLGREVVDRAALDAVLHSIGPQQPATAGLTPMRDSAASG